MDNQPHPGEKMMQGVREAFNLPRKDVHAPPNAVYWPFADKAMPKNKGAAKGKGRAMRGGRARNKQAQAVKRGFKQWQEWV